MQQEDFFETYVTPSSPLLLQEGVTMRTLITLTCFLCLCLFPCLVSAGSIYLNTDNPRYHNSRYGFTFTLPPGQWACQENDGGKEVSIHDGAEGDTDITRVHASVRTGYAGFSLKALFNEEAKGYPNILKENFVPSKNTFSLIAEDVRDNYVYVKYVLKNDKVNMLVITTPKEQKASFDMVVKSVEHSFTPGCGR